MKAYMREYMRGWRDENREQVRKLDRESRERHKDERDARRALPVNRAKNSDATAAYRKRLGFDGRKDQRLRRQYGISLVEYNLKVVAQGGLCPICLRPLAGNRPHVDHDHTTKQNRDILCSRCNQAVGLLKESPVSAERLAIYLRKHGKK
jgi:hypothetical protein